MTFRRSFFLAGLVISIGACPIMLRASPPQNPAAINSNPGDARPSPRLPAWLKPSSSDDKTPKLPRTPDTIEALVEVEKAINRHLPRVYAAVVGVESGSGVIVSRDGVVLTAAHISRKPGRVVKIQLADGRNEWALTLGINPNTDTGVMKIVGPGPWPHLKIADVSATQTGDWCFALGYPLSFKRNANAPVRMGHLLQKDDSRWVTDCILMGGDSGGPLIDIDGNLIAIHSRIKRDADQNLHIPISKFQQEWQQLSESVDIPVFKPEPLNDAESDTDSGVESESESESESDADADATMLDGAAVHDPVNKPSAPIERDGVSRFSIALSPIFHRISPNVIELESKQEDRTLGTVVSTAGLVVAKQSDLASPIIGHQGDQVLRGELVAEDEANDLALIKFDCVFPSAIAFPRNPSPPLPGSMVVSITPESESVALGMVTVQSGTYQSRPTNDATANSLLTNNRWGGGAYSTRRLGFSQIIVHDSVIAPRQCGSPITDLRGNVVGINISRALRVATFAIPIEVVHSLVTQHRAEDPIRFYD